MVNFLPQPCKVRWGKLRNRRGSLKLEFTGSRNGRQPASLPVAGSCERLDWRLPKPQDSLGGCGSPCWRGTFTDAGNCGRLQGMSIRSSLVLTDSPLRSCRAGVGADHKANSRSIVSNSKSHTHLYYLLAVGNTQQYSLCGGAQHTHTQENLPPSLVWFCLSLL